MRLSSLLYFYRLRLRTRWVQELLALVGISVGVALLFAAQIANTSLTGSVKQLVEGTVGQADLQLAARDSRGFDQRTLDRVERLQGVVVAAPMLQTRVIVSGPNGRLSLILLGADRRLADLSGPLLRRFRNAPLPSDRLIGLPSPIATQLGLSIGTRIQLSIGGRSRGARFGAELTEREVGPLIHNPLAIGSLAYVQQLAGAPHRITRILVRTAPGSTTRVRRALERIAGDRLNVRHADFDLELFRQAAEPTNRSTALFAAISAMVGFLFAFNAMLLTLKDRRQLITGLRLDGYSPLAVLQVVLFDALMLGVAASLCGLVLGDQLSLHLFNDTPGYLSFAFPVGGQRVVEWQSVAIAVTGGILATLLAAMLPLSDLIRRRDASDREPSTTTVQPAWSMLIAGVLCLAITGAILLFAPEAAIVGIVALILALMLMLPAILAGLLRLAERALGHVRSAIPLISIGELRSMSARSVALAATGALAVFGSVAIQAARADLQRGLDRSAHDVSAPADVWAAPGGTPNMLATTPFRDRSSGTLARLPEVRSVRTYRAEFLDFRERRVWVMAQPATAAEPLPPSQVVQGDMALAGKRLRAGGWAAVSEAIARDHSLHIGDRLKIPSPQPTTLRVAALLTNIGWPPGAIVLNANDYQQAWGNSGPSAYQVMLRPGISAERGRNAVRRALGPPVSLTVETAAEREHRQRVASREGLSRLDQLASLILLAAALAMAAATGGMVWQRRVRLAALKLDGFDDSTVWRALLLESGLLLGAGCLTGAVFGLLGERLLDRALRDVTGFPVVGSLGLQIALVSFLSVTAVAVTIAALPGYLAARVAPAAALQE